MFYRPSDGHGLPQDPWMACVVPRPIGWITTLDAGGRANLAPYSFFNAVAEDPPMVMFATNGSHAHGAKDTARNIRATGEFVCNIPTTDMVREVKLSSFPFLPGEDEISRAGLQVESSLVVKPPRIRGAPIQIECTLIEFVDLPGGERHDHNTITVGKVVGIHIDDGVLKGGLVDMTRLRPLARLGYGRFSELGQCLGVVADASPADHSAYQPSTIPSADIGAR